MLNYDIIVAIVMYVITLLGKLYWRGYHRDDLR